MTIYVIDVHIHKQYFVHTLNNYRTIMYNIFSFYNSYNFRSVFA